MDKTRLYPAAEFLCEKCGRFNFISLISQDGVPEEVIKKMRDELSEELGLENVAGDFLIQPEKVKCIHCETEYIAEFDN